MTAVKVNNLRTKPSELSNASDPDSLSDLYKPAAGNTSRATAATTAKVIRKKSSKLGNGAANTLEEDASNWIHRDKLAQIESKELEDFRIGRRISERAENGSRDKRQRLASPVRIPDEDDYDPYRDDSGTGAVKSFIPIPAAGRPGGSRIPVPRSVSSSITQSEQGSSGHETRSRTGSNGWTTNPVEQSPMSQPGSNDSGSEHQAQKISPPTSPVITNGTSSALNAAERSSPTKARTQAKSGPPTSRKVTPVAQRQPSSASKKAAIAGAKSPPELKRPSTSNGSAGVRPSTSHRPEGDPPWISTMYKPDPRLPPDQQMLPTHAKRMAQEQWEKEGKTGTVYDREFRLLNSDEFPTNPIPLSQRNSRIVSPTSNTTADGDRIHQTTLTARWPLSDSPPLGSPRSQTSARPGTSGTEHGGYKTIPSISKPRTSTPLHSPSLHMQTMRLPEVQDDDEKKKTGCCACVVM